MAKSIRGIGVHWEATPWGMNLRCLAPSRIEQAILPEACAIFRFVVILLENREDGGEAWWVLGRF